MPHIRSGLTVHIANPTQDTCVPTQATLQVCRKWPQANGWSRIRHDPMPWDMDK